MSNRVVRLSGSQVGNATSVVNLVQWLKNDEGKNILVVSALPEVLNLVKTAIGNVYQTDTEKLSEKLVSFFKIHTKTEPSSTYLNLVAQVAAILTGIRLTGDYSASLKDQLLCFSEKLTAEMFKTRLQSAGTESKVLWPEHIELLATDDFGNATFISINERLISELSEGFYLVPGSYGITAQGKISRAGRTAADYTAAFLTQALNAGKLELWGIDQAFKRADPAIVSDAPEIGRLTYSEASELAYFDHYSFHPRAVEPLEGNHIPIYVISTESDEGRAVTIINTETFVEDQIVKSVACSDDISLLRLNGPGVGLKPGILAKVTSQLNKAGINIKSVITSQISINLILEKETGYEALHKVRQLGFSSVKEISLVEDVSLIGVVGHGMQQSYGVSYKIFGAVARHKINVVLSGSGASDLVSYLVVKSTDKQKSVREIYNAFFNVPKHSADIIND